MALQVLEPNLRMSLSDMILQRTRRLKGFLNRMRIEPDLDEINLLHSAPHSFRPDSRLRQGEGEPHRHLHSSFELELNQKPLRSQ